jgi:dihydroorotate dehydrogenase
MGWRTTAYRAVRPLLFAADPERVHHLALALLASAPGRWLAPIASGVGDPDRSPIELMGLRFRNRVGLAAGFDKDGVAIRGWAALGFGFVELGTVTPRPQAGNPRPRLFRLPADEALINRMGFNNAGADALAARIAAARGHLPDGFVIGVNIGRNRDGDLDDYPSAARSVASVADYVAINVSSPNTPGLRDLQEPSTLTDLLAAVRAAAPARPVLVKLAPDLEPTARATLVAAAVAAGAAGVIGSNTTLRRDGLRSGAAAEAGGLSGRPLRDRSLRIAAELRATAGDGVVIGSGGIGSSGDTRAMLEGGADLVQLWTGMIYVGPGLIGSAVNAASGDPLAIDPR